MRLFKILDEEISYEDCLQIDGAFSVAHINYGESPVFNGNDIKEATMNSRRNSLSSLNRVEDVLTNLYSFDGTEKDTLKLNDKRLLWKIYWIEYINAFDQLIGILPKSIVTINVGRHAIELGLKYLLILKGKSIDKSHKLGDLSKVLFEEYGINDDYMKEIIGFCELYCLYIEGGNDEYFRYPEYNNCRFFAGNRLDISWLSYNIALVLLKLIHFADLDNEI